MNKYDIEAKKQQQFKKEFNESKTEQEKQGIKVIRENFMSREGITREEYSQLIKYYIGIDILDSLIYDRYRGCEVIKDNKKIPFYSMDKRHLKIHDAIVRACFILG